MTPVQEKAMRKKINETYVVHCNTDIAFVGTKKQCQKFKDSIPHLNSYIVQSIEDYGDACYSEGNDNGYMTGVDMSSY